MKSAVGIGAPTETLFNHGNQPLSFLGKSPNLFRQVTTHEERMSKVPQRFLPLRDFSALVRLKYEYFMLGWSVPSRISRAKTRSLHTNTLEIDRKSESSWRLGLRTNISSLTQS